MAEREAKRARLLDLRTRIPYCSQSALSALLQIAEAEELPGASSRQEIAAARDSVAAINTPYGKLHQEISIQTTSGHELKLEVQAPFPCLWHACRASAQFSALIQRCHAAKPSTVAAPWRLLLYCDEVIPGNQLAYTTGRKFWAWYWSILELGSAALANEVTWHTLASRNYNLCQCISSSQALWLRCCRSLRVATTIYVNVSVRVKHCGCDVAGVRYQRLHGSRLCSSAGTCSRLYLVRCRNSSVSSCVVFSRGIPIIWQRVVFHCFCMTVPSSSYL